MFDLNANKLTKFLICLLALFVTACSKDTTTNGLSIFDTSPPNKPIKVNFTLRNGKTVIDSNNIDQESLQYGVIWPRIFDQYLLQQYDNPRIDKQIRFLLKDPDFLINVQRRAEPYLHFIIEEVEAKEIPGEMALLPVIESAFKAHAYSHMKAAGLWQFIPSTGRIFGLKQNSEYDGRRDVYAATAAATRFLKELAEKFDGDWLLGLASYNTGSGNVAKAIRRNREAGLPTDFWSLSLHRETMAYVPRLLAAAKIFANASYYNLPLLPIANKPVFTIIDIGSQLDLAKAAELADITVTDLKVLNPAFNRQYSTPKYGPHRLLIPIEKAEVFSQGLAALPDSLRVKKRAPIKQAKRAKSSRSKIKKRRTVRYKVRRGDNLGLIAKKHRTSVRAIKLANRLKSSHIIPGKTLVIPGSKYVKSKARKRAKPRTYKVRRGDNLGIIARKTSVSTRNLIRWNKLGKKGVIRPGQKLALIKPAPKRIRYTVRKGDSLARISRKFNVSVANLRKWNRNSLGKYIKPGQKIKVLRPAT